MPSFDISLLEDLVVFRGLSRTLASGEASDQRRNFSSPKFYSGQKASLQSQVSYQNVKRFAHLAAGISKPGHDHPADSGVAACRAAGITMKAKADARSQSCLAGPPAPRLSGFDLPPPWLRQWWAACGADPLRLCVRRSVRAADGLRAASEITQEHAGRSLGRLRGTDTLYTDRHARDASDHGIWRAVASW